MKKFRFSLETVLDYKNQALDALRAEHGAILAQVRAQEQLIEDLETEHRQADDDFTQRKLEGINVLDAMSFEQYLRSLERKLQEKGASPAEARYASEWLEAIGALNDAEYAAALARHYSAKGYGPARIKEKLYEKGIPKDLWEDALTDLPENASQIDAYISKKLRGTLPDEKEKRRISNALLRRGYGWGDIKEAWGRFEGA